MRKSPNTPLGTVHRLAIDSQVLAGNLLGDPTLRVIDVYVPAGHDDRAFPCWSMSWDSPQAARHTPTGRILARTFPSDSTG